VISGILDIVIAFRETQRNPATVCPFQEKSMKKSRTSIQTVALAIASISAAAYVHDAATAGRPMAPDASKPGGRGKSKTYAIDQGAGANS
jgi:hypothetical protein